LGEELEQEVDFMEYLLEPQLVGLVHDDEQHFVVRWITLRLAPHMLTIKELVEFQVVGVVGWFSFGMDILLRSILSLHAVCGGWCKSNSNSKKKKKKKKYRNSSKRINK